MPALICNKLLKDFIIKADDNYIINIDPFMKSFNEFIIIKNFEFNVKNFHFKFENQFKKLHLSTQNNNV